MASEIVAIATKCGGPETIIEDKKNGFLIEKNDILAVKKMITSLFKYDKNNLSKIAQNGYSHVKNNYAIKQKIAQTYDYYLQILQ
jgi:glycosyltransferase involved in cell wall biosynthesis